MDYLVAFSPSELWLHHHNPCLNGYHPKKTAHTPLPLSLSPLPSHPPKLHATPHHFLSMWTCLS